MIARVNDAMILSEQFLARIFRDFAKLVIGVSDFSASVGNRHDGVGIERGLQVLEFLKWRECLRFRHLPLVCTSPQTGRSRTFSQVLRCRLNSRLSGIGLW